MNCREINIWEFHVNGLLGKLKALHAKLYILRRHLPQPTLKIYVWIINTTLCRGVGSIFQIIIKYHSKSAEKNDENYI